MAGKRKSKKSRKKQSAVEKTGSQTQGKREFWRSVETLLQVWDLRDLFLKRTSKADRLSMYHYRARSIHVEPAEDTNIPNSLLRFVRFHLSDVMRNAKITTRSNSCEISYYEEYLVGITLYLHFHEMVKKKVYSPQEMSLVEPFLKYYENPRQFDKLHHVIDLILCDFSRLNIRMYWPELGAEYKMKPRPIMFMQLKIRVQEPEVRKFLIRGSNRPAFRVGWGALGSKFTWASLSSKELQLLSRNVQEPRKVFIQSHALIRMEERLDSIYPDILLYHLFLSLFDPEVVPISGNQSLVAYRMYDKKMGYLVAELKEEVVLLRTFLLPMMDGTPEKERLMDRVGLDTADLKYLKFDRLSTFVASDIKENEELVELLKEVGCGDLLYRDELLQFKEDQKAVASTVLTYLGWKKRKQNELAVLNW